MPQSHKAGPSPPPPHISCAPGQIRAPPGQPLLVFSQLLPPPRGDQHHPMALPSSSSHPPGIPTARCRRLLGQSKGGWGGKAAHSAPQDPHVRLSGTAGARFWAGKGQQQGKRWENEIWGQNAGTGARSGDGFVPRITSARLISSSAHSAPPGLIPLVLSPFISAPSHPDPKSLPARRELIWVLLEGKAKGSAWWEGGTPTTSPRLRSEGGASLCQGWGARPVPPHPVSPLPVSPPVPKSQQPYSIPAQDAPKCPTGSGVARRPHSPEQVQGGGGQNPLLGGTGCSRGTPAPKSQWVTP